ncbi:GNAT family N-acetyltransferase [Candidatus Amarobacter glycogenicus]|uniref:GNAT family N-acetyltransferase n=1 Tax=Candidatus Amarobacter glycogenicus TaxID=3140699 RepID=UPI00313637B1|nr:GNAT family N-acetyltransferase [Dehalococcoidia bacterium]
MTSAPSLDEMHALYCLALGRVAALGPEGCAERVGPWLCIDAGLGISKFNVAAVVDSVTRPRSALREAMDWFEARGINARLDLRGSADGAILAAAMVEGFNFWGREPAMVLHPLPRELRPPPPELTMVEVRTDAEIDHYCATDREEFGDQDFQVAMAARAAEIPGVSMHLGLLDGRPVARSMGIVSGALAGVYNVYVAPSERGRGFGKALTSAAVAAGVAVGATAACLESTELAFPLYESLGFRRVDDYIVVGTEDPVGGR